MSSPVIEQYGLDSVIQALQRVDDRYGPQLGELVTRLFGQLRMDPDYADQAQKLLKPDRPGQALWLRSEWPLLWAPTYMAYPNTVTAWLSWVGLDFNPFGPERAELDPRLPWYVIDQVYDEARYPRPLVVTGAPGTGKTAAALMLAYDCSHPPANPRRSGIFPVYAPLGLMTARAQDASSTLSPLVRTTARKILRYLSLRPASWFDLPPYNQDTMRRFLTLAYAGSEPLLAAQVRRLPPSLQKGLLLYPPSENLSPPSHVLDQDWLELLPRTLPAGFNRYEWLVDVPDRTSALLPDRLPVFLNQLIDLAIPLALNGIHLKLFVPDKVADILGNKADLDVIPLNWSKKSLKLMLEYRIRQAGGDSLMALCSPDVALDVEARFIQAAQNSPRRLVRLGNALIVRVARRDSDNPLLTAQDWDAILAKVKNVEAALEKRAPKQNYSSYQDAGSEQWLEQSVQDLPKRVKYMVDLHNNLVKSFDQEELKTLCFELGVNYDDLPAKGRNAKARELIRYLEHCNRIPKLVELGKRSRPDVSWEDRA